jgi:hypothetical protein
MKLLRLVGQIEKAVAEKKGYSFSAITTSGFKAQIRYFFQNGGYCIKFACTTGEVYEIYAKDRGYICINNELESVEIKDQEGIPTLTGSTSYHKSADADLVQTIIVTTPIKDYDGEQVIEIVA